MSNLITTLPLSFGVDNKYTQSTVLAAPTRATRPTLHIAYLGLPPL